MYIDPASGGMLIQIIVAVIAAGGALIFGMRKKIKALFSKKEGVSGAVNPVNANNENADADVIDMLDDDDASDE